MDGEIEIMPSNGLAAPESIIKHVRHCSDRAIADFRCLGEILASEYFCKIVRVLNEKILFDKMNIVP